MLLPSFIKFDVFLLVLFAMYACTNLFLKLCKCLFGHFGVWKRFRCCRHTAFFVALYEIRMCTFSPHLDSRLLRVQILEYFVVVVICYYGYTNICLDFRFIIVFVKKIFVLAERRVVCRTTGNKKKFVLFYWSEKKQVEFVMNID